MFAITNIVALLYWSIVHNYLVWNSYRGKQSFNIPPELHMIQWLEFWSSGPPNIYCGRWGWQGILFISKTSLKMGHLKSLILLSILSCTSVSGQSHEVWHHDCFPLAGPNMQQSFSCCLQYTEDQLKTPLFVLVFF